MAHDIETCTVCRREQPPSELTTSARLYFDESRRSLGLFSFICNMTLNADFVSHIAREALAGNKNDSAGSPIELARKSPGKGIRFLRENNQTLLQMILTKYVDNFETYLSDVLREALRAKPEMLKSRDEVRLDYVLRFSSLSEMIVDLVDRKVSDLSYLGLAKLSDWIKGRMGLELVADPDLAVNISEAIETRNCIVHARGRIGEKYLRNVPATSFKIGDVRELSTDDLFHAAGSFSTVVYDFDAAIASKYGLARAMWTAPVPQTTS